MFSPQPDDIVFFKTFLFPFSWSTWKKVMLHTQNPTCFAIARIAILSRKKCDQIRILYHYFFHQFLILNNRLHTKIIGKVFFLSFSFFLYDSLFLFCCERISSSLMWFKRDLLNWVFQPLEGKKTFSNMKNAWLVNMQQHNKFL